MVNSLVLLYWLIPSFGVAIIIFTVILRVAMVPLTLRQGRQMKAMSAVAPKIQQLKEGKYKNDKQKQSQETFKLYREAGVSPIGCLGPMLLQFPIFIGLFWALRATLPSTPEHLADLSLKLYPWVPQGHEVIPIDGGFIGLDLSAVVSQNPVPFALPLLVAGSTYLMQKMSSTPSVGSQQESQQRMLLFMMPLFIGFITFSFEAGLAIYWIMSNVVGIIIQGFVTGWAPILALASLGRSKTASVGNAGGEDHSSSISTSNIESSVETDGAENAVVPTDSPSKEAQNDAVHRTNSQNTRRSNRARANRARRRTRGSRNRGH